MSSYRQITIYLILLQFINTPIESNQQGTVTSDYGRIFNIQNEYIHVAASLTLADCIRQCTDFSKNYQEYVFDDCFAYNYDMRTYTCELIHSPQPLTYIVGFQTLWMTGFKYKFEL